MKAFDFQHCSSYFPQILGLPLFPFALLALAHWEQIQMLIHSLLVEYQRETSLQIFDESLMEEKTCHKLILNLLAGLFFFSVLSEMWLPSQVDHKEIFYYMWRIYFKEEESLDIKAYEQYSHLQVKFRSIQQFFLKLPCTQESKAWRKILICFKTDFHSFFTFLIRIAHQIKLSVYLETPNLLEFNAFSLIPFQLQQVSATF
ncbi:transmembrane protein, putative (macronuclear) [Tetrahymena thermophila SB210]|uniref:Transmembrane protein, putative n=1 Tax=Tetrahymena thermophila (strain SB210) TaxID=312017 RepID=W7X3B8_TETTS|nr:transmembrane protein, putative [Tetrahymena thermophila SB210]EWS73780.1 transmembrane protein, putative [Tetrahymena thermophila SB210]|eukprot:XP_012653660.1 transmembrane protein, putative [Tetrahymena thermophila SB210]